MTFAPSKSKSPLVRRVLYCTHKERRRERAGRSMFSPTGKPRFAVPAKFGRLYVA